MVACPDPISAAKRPRSRSHPAAFAILSAWLVLGAACPEKRPDQPPASTEKSPHQELARAEPAKAPTTTVTPGETPAKVNRELFTPKAKGKRVTILYTSSVQGYVAPCGCTAEPLGGIARLAAAVDQAREKHAGQVVFVDAGDLLFEKPDDNAPADACQSRARHELLLSTYARKGLVATTLGPLDDVRGHSWRDDLLKKNKVPTLVANPKATTDKTQSGQRETVQRQMQKLGDVQVGITGVSVDSAAEVENARDALAAQVQALKTEGADVIVVLTQAKRRLARALAGESSLANVDVFILGREPGEKPVAPERIGPAGPILAASGIQAQHLGVLEFELAGRAGPLLLDDRLAGAARRARLLRARIKQYKRRVGQEPAGARRDFLALKLEKAEAELGEVFTRARQKPPPAGARVTARSIALVRGLDEEAQAQTELAAYDAAIPELVRGCEASMDCPAPAPGAPVYVGAQACFSCHKDAVQFWQKQRVKTSFKKKDGTTATREVGHSKAWQTLVDGNKTSDRTCVGCHSVGFMIPGGYCKTSEVDFLRNVQCESCHGAGSNHVAAMGGKETLAVKEVTEETCRGCHHVPHIPSTESFVFEEKLLHILGPGHGKLRHDEIKARRARPGR